MNLKIKLSVVFIVSLQLNAQIIEDTQVENRIESLLLNSESELDYSEWDESDSRTEKGKIKINKAKLSDLNAIEFLSLAQKQSILKHIQIYGELQSIYELQTIELLDSINIQELLPYILITQNEFKHILSQDKPKHEFRVLSYWKRQTPEGFLRKDSLKYLGSKLKWAMRYNVKNNGKLSYGFHLEKDAGEMAKQLFSSAYIKYTGSNWIRTCIFGDQQINFGQGLLIGSGLSLGKSAQVMQIVKTRHEARPYLSFNENGFLRGLSISVNLHKKIVTTHFSGIINDDASIYLDSNQGQYFGSIYSNGYYRNAKEINRRNTIQNKLFGNHIHYQSSQLELGFTHVYNKSSSRMSSIDMNNLGHHKFAFDWKWQSKNLFYFGELTGQNLKTPSFLFGVLIALSKQTDVSILFRNYDLNLNNRLGNGFGEGSKNTNEKGLYSGLNMHMSKRIQVKLYNDIAIFPWLKYRVNAQSMASEQFVQIQYSKRNLYSLYIRYRNSKKSINTTENLHLKSLDLHIKQVYRLHFEYFIGEIRLRSRYQHTRYSIQTQGIKMGNLIYQDISFPVFKKLKCSIRWTVFDSEDYNSRGFAFENNVPGTYSIPSYSGNGERIYLLIQAQLNKHLKFWIRFAKSSYSDVESLGSGTDTINSNKLEDINILIQWKI
ncbi:MAG: hypothetical protein R2852_02200 [Bacteroidia bacterium]